MRLEWDMVSFVGYPSFFVFRRKIAKAVSEDFGDVVDFLLQPDCSGKINYKTARKGGYEGYGLNIRSRGQVAPKHKMG